MKTVFIVTPCTFSTRNLLRTDFLKVLKSNKDLKIVILSPAFREDYLIKEFADENVAIEELHRYRNRWNYEYGKIELAFRLLRDDFLTNPKFSETFRIKAGRFRHHHPFLGALRGILMNTLGKSRSFRILMEKLELLLFRDRHYKKIFQRYDPSLVIVSFPFYPSVYPVIRRAMKERVPLIWYISSWDNLTSKGEFPVRATKMIVWNDIMKEEAIKYHHYQPSQIWVCGPAQFDHYFRPLPSKEEFFKRIGADQNKKLITYFSRGLDTAEADPEMLEILNKSIENGEIVYPCQLLIRPSPKDARGYTEKFRKNIVMLFGRRVEAFPDPLDASFEDMIDYACLLKYSDVIICVASTATIEACCFDTPVINIAFDGYRKVPYWESVAKYFDYTHFKTLVEMGGMRVVRNAEELVQGINDYLKHPERDSEGRRKIAEVEAQFLDGKSGERMARRVLEFLGTKQA